MIGAPEGLSRSLLAELTQRAGGLAMPPDVRAAVDTYSTATVDLLQAMSAAALNVMDQDLVRAVESAARAQLGAGEALRGAVGLFLLNHTPRGAPQ